MKIALLIYGEYRSFDECSKTMGFLNEENLDIYFSTWDKTVYTNRFLNLNVVEEVTEQRILKNFVNKNVTCLIESSDNFIEMKFNNKMIHRIKSGIELIKKSNIQYDMIIVTRPDLFYDVTKYTGLDKLEKYKNCVGVPWLTPYKVKDKMLDDISFVSDYDTMIKIVDGIDVNEWNITTIDWHQWWYEKFYLLSNNNIINFEEFDNCVFGRMWVKSENTFQEATELNTIWMELRYLSDLHTIGVKHFLRTSNDVPIRIASNAMINWISGKYSKYLPENF